MANLSATIEALLLVSNRPMTVRELATLAEASPKDTEQAVTALSQQYDQRLDGGILLQRAGGQVQLVTAGGAAPAVQRFLKQETTGELTRAQLETLTIIAYRGPVTRAELEQIRGVNCAIILRNLMIRGLIEAQADRQVGIIRYVVSLDFLKHLGYATVEQLPDYLRLHTLDTVGRLLEAEAVKPAA
ncbi:MAG: SMC-Scp complex subunit ScpB [bacterium]|nr:SMC-Scp complex subunit ScpB [bacterium]